MSRGDEAFPAVWSGCVASWRESWREGDWLAGWLGVFRLFENLPALCSRQLERTAREDSELEDTAVFISHCLLLVFLSFGLLRGDVADSILDGVLVDMAVSHEFAHEQIMQCLPELIDASRCCIPAGPLPSSLLRALFVYTLLHGGLVPRECHLTLEDSFSMLLRLAVSSRRESCRESPRCPPWSRSLLTEMVAGVSGDFSRGLLHALIAAANSVENEATRLAGNPAVIVDSLPLTHVALCDDIPREWASSYQHAETPAGVREPTNSFTLSSFSQRGKQELAVFLSMSEIVGTLFLRLIQEQKKASFLEYSMVEKTLAEMVGILRQELEKAEGEFRLESRNSYYILITVLSKCLLQYFLLFPPDWNSVPKHSLLSIAEEIAPLDTLPAFLLFPFLLPSFFSEEESSFPSLLRCFPLFVSTFPGVSPPSMLQSIHDWIRWVFCHSHQQPSFPANVSQTSQALELHWMHETMREDFPAESFADRLSENEPILRSFVMILLSRLSSFPERTHQFSLQVMRHLIDKKQSVLMECLFPAEHCCDITEGCVTILCGISETAFRSLITQGDNVTRFLEDVLCEMHVCVSPRGTRMETDMDSVRALEYQLRERILQRLRYILQNKTWRENRLFPSIRSLFPECCLVCYQTPVITMEFQFPPHSFLPNKHTMLANHFSSSPKSSSTPPANTTLTTPSNTHFAILASPKHRLRRLQLRLQLCPQLLLVRDSSLQTQHLRLQPLSPRQLFLPLLRRLLELLSLLFPPLRRRLQLPPQLVVHRLQSQVPRGKRPQRRGRHVRQRETGNVRLMAGVCPRGWRRKRRRRPREPMEGMTNSYFRGNPHLEPVGCRGDNSGFDVSSPAEFPKKCPAGCREGVGDKLILRDPRGNESVVSGGVYPPSRGRWSLFRGVAGVVGQERENKKSRSAC